MTPEDIRTAALARGHTLPVLADCDHHTLEGWTAPEAEFDGRFAMTCGDTGDLLMVNGWQFTVEVVEPLRMAA